MCLRLFQWMRLKPAIISSDEGIAAAVMAGAFPGHSRHGLGGKPNNARMVGVALIAGRRGAQDG